MTDTARVRDEQYTINVCREVTRVGLCECSNISEIKPTCVPEEK